MNHLGTENIVSAQLVDGFKNSLMKMVVKIKPVSYTHLMAEYYCHPADMLVKMPDDMDWTDAAMAEPLTISLHGIHRGGLKAGEYCAIIGAGPIGLLAGMIAQAYGAHAILLDLVDVYKRQVSQFSYGKIEEARLKGNQLPVPGGYDEDGNLTTDPAAIEKTWRVLPMGYWKGSGISILLDLISTVLTNANSVQKIGTFGDEVGLSQIMIAIDPGKFNDTETTDRIVDELVAVSYTHLAHAFIIALLLVEVSR